ncbi:MAG: hypothetical protein HYX51_00310 [Chloroflexi bacterium]|nr:hypothetical protein [Chloroflexota bacterium]
MTKAEVLEAINRLPLTERLELVETVLRDVRGEVACDVANREAKASRRKEQRREMAVAAERLRDKYLTDRELTAFSALDGEDFVESR